MRVPGVLHILFLTSWKPHKDGQYKLYFIGKEIGAQRKKVGNLPKFIQQVISKAGIQMQF